MKNNGVMMQYFEWYLKKEPHLWKQIPNHLEELSKNGISALWLPPAYKGSSGNDDVGYGIYDLYDLGEFDQKGSVETKYGTKQEYLDLIQACHESNMDIYTDIVLNHKIGADEIEQVPAIVVKGNARNEEIEKTVVDAWTKFTFPGRKGKYSSFVWNWHHFDGIDYDNKTQQKAIYRLYGKNWDAQVSNENENYDYLMGADLDFENEEVRNELVTWGLWYQSIVHMDGVRLDACKHIQFTFFKQWLQELRKANKELFAVGEYWSYNIDELLHYLDVNENQLSLFDVVLHGHLHDASCSNGNYDLRNLLKGTLVEQRPMQAVTFVDNHDTQPSQALSSWVLDWFKPQAYSVILLRKDGYPCVFYGDYYGIEHDGIGPVHCLETLLTIRKQHNYGEQHDYFDDFNIVGWTREGDDVHDGFACIFTDSTKGTKQMYVGKKYANATFTDVLQNHCEDVVIDENGNGVFTCEDGSISVYTKRQ